MEHLRLLDDETAAIKGLLAELKAQYSSAEETAFLHDAPAIAGDLPRRVRRFLNDFRLLEPAAGACLISAFPVDDASLGPTPTHWRQRPAISPALAEEMLFVLFGSLLGEAIGWAAQQDGSIVHDIMPIKSDETSQISTGSRQPIWWHNEDAFHAYRGDYVGLMCLRNRERVPTTLSSLGTISLDEGLAGVLFEPHFVIRPDYSHLRNGRAGTAAPEGEEGPCAELPRVPVLFGDRRAPYLRLDPYFMCQPESPRAQAALDALVRTIDANLAELVLGPGDCLFVDNYRAVHGRRSFRARYDGSDRWLKRLNITRDLRKSRDARPDFISRVIGADAGPEPARRGV